MPTLGKIYKIISNMLNIIYFSPKFFKLPVQQIIVLIITLFMLNFDSLTVVVFLPFLGLNYKYLFYN